MTTPVLFKEYVWLVNTIYQARNITLEEINRKWVQTEMSDGVEIARNTFIRHKNAIATFMDAMKSLDNMKSAIKAYSGAGTYKFVLQRDDSDTPIKTYTIIIE